MLESGERRVLEGDLLKFQTRPGGMYRLVPEGATLGEEDLGPPDFGSEGHWFGVKRRARF